MSAALYTRLLDLKVEQDDQWKAFIAANEPEIRAVIGDAKVDLWAEGLKSNDEIIHDFSMASVVAAHAARIAAV